MTRMAMFGHEETLAFSLLSGHPRHGFGSCFASGGFCFSFPVKSCRRPFFTLAYLIDVCIPNRARRRRSARSAKFNCLWQCIWCVDSRLIVLKGKPNFLEYASRSPYANHSYGYGWSTKWGSNTVTRPPPSWGFGRRLPVRLFLPSRRGIVRAGRPSGCADL